MFTSCWRVNECGCEKCNCWSRIKITVPVQSLRVWVAYGSRISRKSESDYFKKVSDRPKVFRFFRFSTELELEIRFRLSWNPTRIGTGLIRSDRWPPTRRDRTGWVLLLSQYNMSIQNRILNFRLFCGQIKLNYKFQKSVHVKRENAKHFVVIGWTTLSMCGADYDIFPLHPKRIIRVTNFKYR